MIAYSWKDDNLYISNEDYLHMKDEKLKFMLLQIFLVENKRLQDVRKQ